MLAAQSKSNTARSDARPDLGELAGLSPSRRIPGRNRTKAEIRMYRLGRHAVAVKDYGSCPLLIRHTLGRWLVRREARAYRAARQVAGLPVFYGTIGPFALALEWIEARPLAAFGDRRLPRGWDEAAAAILDRLHERGIALADLHHRDVLVSETGDVHLVDLATAWVCGSRPGPLRRRLFRRLRRLDRLALARMRARSVGQDPDAVVAAADASTAAWHRRGRRIKRLLARLRSR